MSGAASTQPTDNVTGNRLLFMATAITTVAMLLGTAWVSDDAFITLRVIDNFVNGWGLRFNIIERVQVSTHPLWLFFLTPFYYFTREPVLTNMLVSVAVSLTALWLLGIKIATNRQRGCFFTLAAMLSVSIMSFSTSGLETPLSFLLVALFVLQFYRPGVSWITAFIAGLLFLNRLDMTVLLGPAMACLFLQERGLKKQVAIVLAASLPVLFWMAFSLAYYGTPFPNTAYAKLGTGLDTMSLIRQGSWYTLYFVKADLLLAMLMGKAIFDSLRARDARTKMLGMGIILYTAYTVFIGGDFMLGRFFSVPGFLALCLLAQSPALQPLNAEKNRRFAFPVMIFCWLLLVLRNVPVSPWATNWHGILNERLFYYKTDGLLSVLTGSASKWPHELPSVWREVGMQMKAESSALKHPVILANNIGMMGYYAGPNVHIVDALALSDPFLSRLPAISIPPPRVGHYARRVPFGYCETVLKDNPTTDIESFRPLLNDVTLASRAPLFTPERLNAIRRLMFEQKNYNLGNFKNGAVEKGVYELYDSDKVVSKIIQTR